MMKIPKIALAVGYVEEELIWDAAEGKSKRSILRPLGAVAASFAALLLTLAAILLFLPKPEEPPIPGGEHFYERGYTYAVTEGEFSAYVGGRVIAEDRIGEKIADVTLLAGWRDRDGNWISTEDLLGEIYQIRDIPRGTAVALRFKTAGEAVTAEHYYTLLNPAADLSGMEDYLIPPPDLGETGRE